MRAMTMARAGALQQTSCTCSMHERCNWSPSKPGKSCMLVLEDRVVWVSGPGPAPASRCAYSDLTLALRRLRRASGDSISRCMIIDLDVHQVVPSDCLSMTQT